jgi:hypothetical protein
MLLLSTPIVDSFSSLLLLLLLQARCSSAPPLWTVSQACCCCCCCRHAVPQQSHCGQFLKPAAAAAAAAAAGMLFLSTPNVASFSSLARSVHGFAPYAFSKYLSYKDGKGEITHVRGACIHSLS